MAQVFTLDFTYRNTNHSAIVTLRAVGSDHAVSVQLLDTDLLHIVPDGELSFHLSNASRQPTAAIGPGYNEVEAALREALTRYLRRSGTAAGQI